MDPRLFEQLKAIADSIRLARGHDPTVEEVARAYVVLTELAAAMSEPGLPGYQVPVTGQLYEAGLPAADLATGMTPADDYKPPRFPWRIK